MNKATQRPGRFVTRVITPNNTQRVTVVKHDGNGVGRKVSFSYNLTPEAEAAIAKLHAPKVWTTVSPL